MQQTPHHIANLLRSKLPTEKKEASWGYLAGEFPWYPVIHFLRAADHRDDEELLQKAALYQNDLLRLNAWLNTVEAEDALPPSVVEPLAETEMVPDETIQPQDGISAWEQKTESEEPLPASEEPLTVAAHIEPIAEPSLDDLIPITPYYTVDYFASQGIKIEKKVSPDTDTELDQQVKSFTEWLKTMKKLKFQPQTTYTDPLVDSNARASLSKKEIVTEAMAEVWAKQGNLQMAAQVYAKLMLLHPEKTPYFAARLQELKQFQ